MRKILLILYFCLISLQVNAQIRCSRDSFGNKNCYGTNADGETVNTRSSTDSFGNTNIYGY